MWPPFFFGVIPTYGVLPYAMMSGVPLPTNIVHTVLSWAAMGARSSSTKNWGWEVTRRGCLNGSTVPVQAPTTDAKLVARVYQIDLHRGFARASSRPARQWRKLYRARERTLVASLPSFHSVRPLQYANFVLQAKNADAGCCGA